MNPNATALHRAVRRAVEIGFAPIAVARQYKISLAEVREIIQAAKPPPGHEPTALERVAEQLRRNRPMDVSRDEWERRIQANFGE